MTKKRLYISADIEGVAGVVSPEQSQISGFEFQLARKWMTHEVISACEAAFSSGIEEIVISDSHGSGQNLLLEQLPDKVQVVRSWPRPLCMMEGIQEGEYVGALLLGYHSGATDMRGVLAHTLHGLAIKEIRLNGQVASETVISAATAAHYGVPVIMVSGDDAYIEHAEEVLPPISGSIETVTTKWALSRTSARTLVPRVACESIAASVKTAIARLPDFSVNPLSQPIELEVCCVKRAAAELLAYLPTVTRLDAYSIGWQAKDMAEVSQFLSFLLASGVLLPD